MAHRSNRFILQIALLLCFATTALSRSYHLLRFQQRSSKGVCQRILRELNGTLTTCLQQRINNTLPQEIQHPQLLHREDVLWVTYEMLQQIFGVFRKNFSRTAWNESITKELFLELKQQMDDLKTALQEREKEGRKEEDVTRCNRTISHLKKYYHRLLKYLKASGYSSCAWVIVKTEIYRNFSFLNRLTSYLPD